MDEMEQSITDEDIELIGRKRKAEDEGKEGVDKRQKTA